MTKTPIVFLSHSSKDVNIAKELAGKLRKHNIEVWIDDEKIRHGSPIIVEISEGLKKADLLLFLLSSNSGKSPWCRKEYEYHLKKEIESGRIQVIVIRLDVTEVPPLLDGKAYLDMRMDVVEEDIVRLAKDIEEHSRKTRTVPDPSFPELPKWTSRVVTQCAHMLLSDGFTIDDQIKGWSRSAEIVAAFYYDDIPINRVKELRDETSLTQTFWALRGLRHIYGDQTINLPINWLRLQDNLHTELEKETSPRHIATSVLYIFELVHCLSSASTTPELRSQAIAKLLPLFEDQKSLSRLDILDFSYVIRAMACVLSMETDINIKHDIQKYKRRCEMYLTQIPSHLKDPLETFHYRANLSRACRLAISAFLISEVFEVFKGSDLVRNETSTILKYALEHARSIGENSILRIPQFAAPIILAQRNAKLLRDDSLINESILLRNLYSSETAKHWSWSYLCGQSISMLLLTLSRGASSLATRTSRESEISSLKSWDNAQSISDESIFNERIRWLNENCSLGERDDARLWLSVDGCLAKMRGKNIYPDKSLLQDFHELSSPHFLPIGVYFPEVRSALRDATNALVIYEDAKVSVFISNADLKKITAQHESMIDSSNGAVMKNVEHLIAFIGCEMDDIIKELSSAAESDLKGLLRRIEYYLEVLGLTSLRLEKDGNEELNAFAKNERRKIVDKIAGTLCKHDKFPTGITLNAQLHLELASAGLRSDAPRAILKNGDNWQEIGTGNVVSFCKLLLNNDSKSQENAFMAKGTVAQPPEQGHVQGCARVIKRLEDFLDCEQGEILVVGDFPTNVVHELLKQNVSPAAVISQEAGIACHAATVCREFGWPCAVGVPGVLTGIQSGWLIDYYAKGKIAKISAKPHQT